MDVISMIASAYTGEQGSELIGDVIKFIAAYYIVRRDVTKQFSSITSEIAGIRLVVGELSQNIQSVEHSHQTRITSLEMDVKELKKQNPSNN